VKEEDIFIEMNKDRPTGRALVFMPTGRDAIQILRKFNRG